MPVHNALPYLDEAVASILDQTSRDFEFVIFDDASSDGSAERLEQWAARDPRIRLVRGKRNLGPAESSNEVVRNAAAPLIARMDADDISMPERLERQLRLMADNPDAGIVASLCDIIDSSGRKLRGAEHWRLARKSFFTPFPHGSMMFRRELFDSIGGYRPQCAFWEDLDFVLRASEEARILVIPQALYRWRYTEAGTRLASDETKVENALDLRYRAIARIRRNRSYDDLLREPLPTSDELVDPRVFVSLGSLALWSRRRPRVARRFLARARLRFDLATLFSAAWVMWASASPGTLRGLTSLVSRIRNAAHGTGRSTGEPVDWVPSRGAAVSASTEAKQGVQR
jgi:glycosyltransferase involved in cell wall biosynthesis